MKKLILGLAAASTLAVASSANAAFVMFLDDTSTVGIDRIILDQGGAGASLGAGFVDPNAVAPNHPGITYLNSNLADGALGLVDAISFSGSVGVFNVNVTSAFTKSSTLFPVEMSMTTNSSSNAAGTLVIGVSDTDFISDTAYDFSLSSTAVGSTVTATGYQDPANALFGLTNATSLLSLTAGSGSQGADDFNFLAAGAPFSLSIVKTITHTAGQTSNTTAVFNIPEPSVLALFGAGLLGLGLARRRMKK